MKSEIACTSESADKTWTSPPFILNRISPSQISLTRSIPTYLVPYSSGVSYTELQEATLWEK